MKYLKSYNESIKDYLKPKSEEDIKKSLNNIDIVHTIDTEDIRNMLFTLCDRKFKNDIDFYNFILEHLINKFILKLRSYKFFGYIPSIYNMIDLLNILNRKELIKLTNKII